MKKNVKEKWVAALKSGDYKQGVGRLRDKDDHYCCLGVLCDVLGRKWVDPSEFRPSYGIVGEGTTERYVLPDTVLDRVAMSHSDENILIKLNDEGFDFNYIARWIEQHL